MCVNNLTCYIYMSVCAHAQLSFVPHASSTSSYSLRRSVYLAV